MRRIRIVTLAVGSLLLIPACGSTDSTPSAPSSDGTATAATADPGDSTGPTDATTSPNSVMTDTAATGATTTSTVVPDLGSGYELVTVEAQRPYITIEGGTCDLSRPWTAQLAPTQGGLSGLLEYAPTGDGTIGSVTVTFSVPDTDLAITGTTTYSITPLTSTAAVPTTNSGTAPDRTDTFDPGDLPDGALRIQYGAITFTANQPGAMIPTLPGDVWGPPLLVPSPRDC